jgi:hypothetical protein
MHACPHDVRAGEEERNLKLRQLGLLLGIVPVALGAAIFAGCGDDDDDGGGGGGARTGTDEQFVSDFCKALKDFQDSLSDTLSDPEALSEGEDAVAEALAEPFRDFADAFKDMRVPNDLKDWHSDATKALDQAADQLEDGKFDEGIFAEEEPFEDPPQDVQDRLQKLAEDNEDCKDADFTFDQ